MAQPCCFLYSFIDTYHVYRYNLCVIKSWSHQGTADIWDGTNSRTARAIPKALWATVARKLDRLDAATELRDLVSPPGNRLHPLKGDQKGRHAIRVNDQYRISFAWKDGDAWEVRCEDYH